MPVLSVRVLPRRGVTLRAALATLEIMTVLVVAHTWAGGELPTIGWLAVTAALVLRRGLGGAARAGAAVGHRAGPDRRPSSCCTAGWSCWPRPSQEPAARARIATSSSPGRWCWPTWSAPWSTALVWELRRRAVEVVLTWAEAGLVPVPDAAPDPLPHVRRCCPCGARSVVVPVRGPPVPLLAA